MFGIGKGAEEGHTEVREEQRDGWNEEEEGDTEVREEQRDGWNEEEAKMFKGDIYMCVLYD